MHPKMIFRCTPVLSAELGYFLHMLRVLGLIFSGHVAVSCSLREFGPPGACPGTFNRCMG